MPSSTELLLCAPSVPISLSIPPITSYFSLSSRSSPCMAASSKPAPAPSHSFSHLSSELLALICEQLRDIDARSLVSVRLVSKRLDAIATPIAYRFLTLNERLVAPDAERRYPHALYHISLFTNHIVIPSNLDPEGISGILSRIRRLNSVCWRYIDGATQAAGLWLPSDLANLGNINPSNFELHVENLPLRDFDSNLRDAYTRAIPARLLTSLKLANPTPALSTRLNSLKRLLVETPQLKTLHFEDRGQGTSFAFSPGDRMPALVNLLLRSYDWCHTADDVRKHWDFSRIKSLELVSIPVFHFLRSVSFEDFSHLHTLHVEDYSAHLPDKREDATAGLYLLVKNNIRALEVLNITCHTRLFPVDAIMVHRHSLQVLRFRDHVGFSEDDQSCPTLCSSDLVLLSQRLKHVHTLELDMDVRMCDPAAFLKAVCLFPAVNTLTLHIQTMVRPFDDSAPDSDCDYNAAMSTFRWLIYEKGRTGAPTGWKRIVINVGGWRRVMVRRLGSAWRRQNDMGIYAERCFVFERDLSGNMAVREEVCVENTSRGGSPDP
ncbi:hypothetical protein FZEAL_6378 [Fusarium zealandicum]|uniref:F-box domain-containing protein n=1 Tax=Fusarium zealandicum TaxID=1053134 RepID=A0A8H4UI15_9HYPO|nr:hypothetical protein FZEAL_6378 [Fusarium zealandicum]